MKKTALYDQHVALGARMAPFAGFEMPIQYEGILKEHRAVRGAEGVFDTCHMGELRISGADALQCLERLVSCDVTPMSVGQCRYGLLCNEHGGVLDDLLVYRLAEDCFLLVVNAATRDGDRDWISRHLAGRSRIDDLSEETAKIDVQGPLAPRILAQLLSEPLRGIPFYRFRRTRHDGHEIIVSRTGYTGEVGFEIYCDRDLVTRLWTRCIELGAAPSGLGARDTLRLEMGFPLYGHEFAEERNAGESGFTTSISTTKEFVGSAAVRDESRREAALVGLAMDGRRAAGPPCVVSDTSGSEIGEITSGSFSPSLGRAVALAYIRTESAVAGTRVAIATSRGPMGGRIAGLPFYKKGTLRKPLAEFL